HQSSLQCPCSHVSVQYDKFIQIEPFYHELCQSDFISDEWINYLSLLYEQSWNNSILSDWRRIAQFQFQTLRSFCELAQEAIENELESFKHREFIQSQLILEELFHAQISSFITEFIDSLSKTFMRTLQFVQNITAHSLLMSGASMTNVIPNNQVYMGFEEAVLPFSANTYTFFDGFTCTCSSSTATTCMGTATLQNNIVPGFQTGCYMMNALFKSSLDILYNQSFIDMITDSSKTFQKLNSSIPSKTVENLLSQMFVDYWSNTTLYGGYFNECAPDICQYSVNRRHGFIEIVALIIGLFGGLSAALRFIVPFIIETIAPNIRRFIALKSTRTTQLVTDETTTEFSAGDRIKKLIQLVIRTIVELNLFESIPSSQNENIIRKQRHSTRVYIILLFTSSSILIFFTSIRMQTISVSIEMPTLPKFIQLYNQYPSTLNCPCSQVAIQYNQIILSLQPEYHQICSSEFVSSKWINLKFLNISSTRTYTHDIRCQSQIHFQLLSTLCYAAIQTVEDNLQSFYKTKFVSHQLLTYESFRIQVDLIVEQFKRIIPELFQYALELTKANFELNRFIVPMNAVFILSSCLSQIKAFIDETVSPTDFTTLKLSSESYANNSYDKIEELANKLFIQSWTNKSSYESYFNECQPLTCQYSYQSRLTLLYIITTVIGFIGGLVIATRLLAPVIVMLAHRVWNYILHRQRNDVIPTVQTTSLESGNTVTVTVDSPSVSKYIQLYAQYSTTLKCPCSQIATKRDKFILQIEPQYHEICSSVFVSFKWLNNLEFPYYIVSFGYDNDFRGTIQMQFLTISRFCSLSQKIINTSLSTFRQTDFVTARVVSQTEFIAQTKVLFEQFKRTTARQLMQIFKLVLATNHGNQLATVFPSNWDFIMKYPQSALMDFSQLPALSIPKTYEIADRSVKLSLLGFRIGCYPLNALLQSNLLCLYDQTCLGIMRAGIYYSKLIPTEILTYSSLMEPNTTIETILSKLFVSQWFYDFSFERYFTECAPQFCQYSHLLKFNQVYIITTLIALFGGLTKGLHFGMSYIAILIFKLFDYLKQKNKHNSVVVPYSEEINVAVIDDTHNRSKSVSISITKTIQLPLDPIDERTRPWITRIDVVYLIVLILLIIAAIVVTCIVWIKGNENENYKIMLSDSSTSLITSTTATEPMTTLTNTCYMTLKYQTQTYPTGSDPKSFIINDLNRDSILDLAVTSYVDNTFSILLGNGNGTFQTPLLYSTGDETRPWGIASLYINNDTLLDLAIALTGPFQLAFFYGVATNILFTRSPNTVSIGFIYNDLAGEIETSDLNDDGRTDLIVLNRRTSTTDILAAIPLWIFFNLDRYPPFRWPTDIYVPEYNSIVVGDFDNNGKQNDIAVCSNGPMMFTYLNLTYTSDAPFWSQIHFMNGETSSLIKGMFNDDEFEDLAVISPTTDTLKILLARGNGTFIQQNYATTTHPTSVTRINFNNDEIDDLAVLNCNGTVIVFLGKPAGIFDQKYLSFNTSRGNSNQCAISLKVADLNQDERDDLIFLNTETYSINVLLSADCDE
ncbi:unnamed protein product, partial [Rotaria sordida]